MSDPKLGWGVIGIGDVLQRAIAPALVAEENCELVAAVSRDQDRADAFAARFGVRHASTSLEGMLTDDDVQAVYVATPNALHADQVVAAARAGKHVFCEKPLATNPADARRAVDACAEAGVELGVNFHKRQFPWVRDVAAMISHGEIGDVEVVQVQVGSGPRHYDNWRVDQELAGLGSVYNIGVHVFDFLRLMLHGEAEDVVAMFDRAPETGSVEMLALILLRFGNGALAYCNCNERVPFPANDITIQGSRGRIVGTGITRPGTGGSLAVLTEGSERVTQYAVVDLHRRSVAAFTEAVLGGREPAATGRDGLVSAYVCEAIATSVREERVVAVRYETD